MSNYLQKIAASGARTTLSVKHPTLSQAVMPPAYPMVQASTSASSEHDEPFRMASDQAVGSERGITSPVTPAGKQPKTMPAIDSNLSAGSLHSEASPATAAPYSSSVVVQAPRGLRRAQHAVHAKPAEPALGYVFSDTRHEQASSSETSAKAPNRSTESTALQGWQTSVKQADTVLITTYAASPISKPMTTGARMTPQEGPARLLSKGMLSEGGTKSVVPPPLMPMQIRNLSDADDQSVLPRKPMAIASTAAQDRRSRISIGRIDVQVNNQPAPQPPSPQRAKQTVNTNALAARYLSRFLLRP